VYRLGARNSRRCVLLIKSVHMVEGDEFGRGKKGGEAEAVG